MEQLGYLRDEAAESGDDASRLVISYQVTLNIGDSEASANAAFGSYISQYYPELSKAMDLSNWGPVGTPEAIIEWFRTFADAGVDHFICRFGSLDLPTDTAVVLVEGNEKGPLLLVTVENDETSYQYRRRRHAIEVVEGAESSPPTLRPIRSIGDDS